MNPLAAELIAKQKKQNQVLNEAERELKRTVFKSMPLMLQIEPTNRCSFKCNTCARSYYNHDLNQSCDFPEELLESLEMPMAFARTVLFGGYGEPLMGENFQLLFGLASDYGCTTELITNGSFLDDEMIEFLCGMGHGCNNYEPRSIRYFLVLRPADAFGKRTSKHDRRNRKSSRSVHRGLRKAL